MKRFLTEVLAIHIYNDESVLLRVKKPAGYAFEAGQYCTLYLAGVSDDPKGDWRTLSIASSPDFEYLEFALRLSDSGFKQRLKDLFVGSLVEIGEPFGELFKADRLSTACNYVFIAGGVGITPFRAILQKQSFWRKNHSVTLLYANKTKNTALFYDEFLSLEKTNSLFRFIATFSEENIHRFDTRIDEELLQSILADKNDEQIFISGSHTFLHSIIQLLKKMGYPKSQIHFELFCGYCEDHECCCSYFEGES